MWPTKNVINQIFQRLYNFNSILEDPFDKILENNKDDDGLLKTPPVNITYSKRTRSQENKPEVEKPEVEKPEVEKSSESSNETFKKSSKPIRGKRSLNAEMTKVLNNEKSLKSTVQNVDIFDVPTRSSRSRKSLPNLDSIENESIDNIPTNSKSKIENSKTSKRSSTTDKNVLENGKIDRNLRNVSNHDVIEKIGIETFKKSKRKSEQDNIDVFNASKTTFALNWVDG